MDDHSDSSESEDGRLCAAADHTESARDPRLSLALQELGEGAEEKQGIQEREVLCVFELPDGSQGEAVFRLGQTVELLKAHVERHFGIPMHAQELRLDGQLMLDPLSLLDYEHTRGAEELFIDVRGEMREAFRLKK